MNDTIGRLLQNVEPDFRQCDGAALYSATVLYLFRGLNYKTYTQRLTKLLGRKPNVRALTEALGCNGYLIKNLKIWMFYVVKNRLNEADAMVLSRRWKIERRDVQAFRYIDRTALAYIKRLAKEYQAYTLEDFDALAENIVRNQDFLTWLGKFTSKKHRFIATSQSYSLAYIRQDLQYNGIQGLYNMYPRMKSELHALNIVKRTIHNTGINLIYHFTSQKAGRLIKNENGSFEARTVSIESVRETLEMQEVDCDMDLRADFVRLIEAHRGKKRKFIELLAGNYCPRFTMWLRERGHRVDTNEALQDKLNIREYMKKCLQFLGVEFKKGMQFVQKLREQFQPYRRLA